MRLRGGTRGLAGRIEDRDGAWEAWEMLTAADELGSLLCFVLGALPGRGRQHAPARRRGVRSPPRERASQLYSLPPGASLFPSALLPSALLCLALFSFPGRQPALRALSILQVLRTSSRFSEPSRWKGMSFASAHQSGRRRTQKVPQLSRAETARCLPS